MEFRIWLLNMYPWGQYSPSEMSKCDSISWLKITGIGNLDVIHVRAIEACVRDFKSLFPCVIFICEDPCMESRYHDFILVGIQENVRR